MIAPSRPKAAIVPGTASYRLIRGVLRVNADPLHIARIDLLTTSGWALSLIDSGDGDALTPSGDTTFHILWAQDEGTAMIDVDGASFPVAPGDTMSVPGGTSVRRSPGLLLIQINATGLTLEGILPPDHGEESFDGYNRRTDYRTPSAFALERWKITQPLTIPAAPSPYALVGLVTPLALSWTGSTDLLGRGECCLIAPDTGLVTLFPDGLGYALIVR